MKARQLVGIALIVPGVRALIYGGFTPTEEIHDVVEFAFTAPVWG